LLAPSFLTRGAIGAFARERRKKFPEQDANQSMNDDHNGHKEDQ
jgi:hypothetical protein